MRVPGLLMLVVSTLLVQPSPARCDDPPASPASSSDLAADLARIEEQALAAWSARRYADAIAHWNRLIAAAPAQRSYRLGLVRTLVSAGDIVLAREALLAAKLIPVANRSEEYNTLVAEGEVLGAEQRDEAAAAAFEAAEDLVGRSGSRSRSPRTTRDERKPWRLNTGLLVDRFDNRRGTENQLLVELGYRYSRDFFAYALYERHDRFDAIDDVYVAGISVRPSEKLGVRLNLGGSPDAAFRPRVEGSIILDWQMTEWLRPQVGYQRLDYAEGDVTTVIPGVRLLLASVADLELQYALTTEIDGSRSRIGGARIGWNAHRRWLPSLNYHRGEEALPPQIRARFQRTGAGVVWLASREWQLRLDYAYEDREDAYVAHSLALGAGFNF
ncbi:MAG: YaiO family outer membrane beta-barrel protein [Panacagrimonas sp.]